MGGHLLTNDNIVTLEQGEALRQGASEPRVSCFASLTWALSAWSAAMEGKDLHQTGGGQSLNEFAPERGIHLPPDIGGGVHIA